MLRRHLTILTFIALLCGQASGQGSWTQKADFGGTARQLAVGFSIGTKGYIGTGGDDFVGAKQDFWEWDQASNVWTQKANFGGAARRYAVGFSIGTKGYIGTGYDGMFDYQDFWEWDQTTNVWTQKANFGGTARWAAVGFSIGSKGYIGTGYDDNTPPYATRDFWEWDQATDTWTQKANVGGTGRYMAVSFSIGTKGYIGTGQDSAYADKQDFWEWDQATNVWTQKANVGGTGRHLAVGFSIGTKGYIGTGADSNNLLKQDFWQWDQASNTWIQKTNVGGLAKFTAVGFSIGTRGYIGTGEDTIRTRDLWEYTPDWVGINEIPSVNSMTIFPNPFSTQTVLQTNNLLHNATLTVYNCFGQTVAQIKNISGQSITFNRGNLASGVYFVRLSINPSPSGGGTQGGGSEAIYTGKLVIIDK